MSPPPTTRPSHSRNRSRQSSRKPRQRSIWDWARVAAYGPSIVRPHSHKNLTSPSSLRPHLLPRRPRHRCPLPNYPRTLRSQSVISLPCYQISHDPTARFIPYALFTSTASSLASIALYVPLRSPLKPSDLTSLAEYHSSSGSNQIHLPSRRSSPPSVSLACSGSVSTSSCMITPRVLISPQSFLSSPLSLLLRTQRSSVTQTISSRNLSRLPVCAPPLHATQPSLIPP
jgi:hypothetical protein